MRNSLRIEKRVVQVADYIIENEATVRKTADVTGISKSTVHKDVSERLQEIDLKRYRMVRVVLDKNKEERHIRGGESTKKKYLSLNRR